MSDSPRTDGNAEIIISDGCHQLEKDRWGTSVPNVQFGRGRAPMIACISKYDFSSWDFRRKVGPGFTRGEMISLKLTSSMRREHVRYVALETTIGIAINAILSMGLAYAMFEAHVAMPGDSPALLGDIGTQCFIVALASVVVPTLLTRRRCHGGTIQRLERRAGWLDNLLLRALLRGLTGRAGARSSARCRFPQECRAAARLRGRHRRARPDPRGSGPCRACCGF